MYIGQDWHFACRGAKFWLESQHPFKERAAGPPGSRLRWLFIEAISDESVWPAPGRGSAAY
jgi:hypothetical protein